MRQHFFFGHINDSEEHPQGLLVLMEVVGTLQKTFSILQRPFRAQICSNAGLLLVVSMMAVSCSSQKHLVV